MKLLTKDNILGIKKRFWLYIIAGFAIFMGLLLTPQGRLESKKEGWQSIMPSGLFEPDEDGSSYGYNDRCGDNLDCRTCKANLACLKCMDNCYNRHGAFYKKDNPRLAGAMLCVDKCVTAAEEESPNAD